MANIPKKLSIAEKVHAKAKLLGEEADLIPQSLRDSWLNYLKGHLEHYVSVISRLPPPQSCGWLLEIGCVPGHLTVIMKDLGYQLCCVDINTGRLAELWKAHGIDVQKVNIETERLPFDDGYFSVVLFTEVLEHLRIQPIFALREVFRVTNDGGQLILSVPNITPRKRWKFLFGHDYQGDIVKSFEQLEKVGHLGHIRLYSIMEIRRILEYVGYTDMKFAREGKIKGSKLWQLLFPWRQYFRDKLYAIATH
jgi:SAM-dependent methyltransferase